jgi:hypothetical protein
MSAIANQNFNQLYLQGYQPLQNARIVGGYPPCGGRRIGSRLYDLWLQGTVINFREEEIFIFSVWVYAIMRLSTPTLFAN